MMIAGHPSKISAQTTHPFGVFAKVKDTRAKTDKGWIMPDHA